MTPPDSNDTLTASFLMYNLSILQLCCHTEICCRVGGVMTPPYNGMSIYILLPHGIFLWYTTEKELMLCDYPMNFTTVPVWRWHRS